MRLHHHEISWELSVWIEGDGLPTGRRRFTIHVLPMMVLDDRAGGQSADG